LERQRVELVEKQRLEREKLLEKIRKAEEKAKEKFREKVNNNSGTTEKQKELSTTEDDGGGRGGENQVNGGGDADRKAHLQKMLTDLKNQAKALNIPASEYTLPPLSDPRTKSTFRGSTYRGRARALPRGGRVRGSSSRSLDLRPKSILVPNIIGTSSETAIREWVIMNCADAIVETTVATTTTVTDVGSTNVGGAGIIVKFKERYEAEEFLEKLKGPPLGPLRGDWYVPSSTSVQHQQQQNEQSSTTNDDVGKEYVYDEEEEEEGEVGNYEGRWKR